MIHLRPYLRRLASILCVALLVGATPMSAWALDTAPTPSPAPAPAAPTNGTSGVDHPTGAAAGTFSYNSQTGLWENAHFTWDPATQQTKPKVALEYTYNNTTGLWDSLVWEYQPGAGGYVQVTRSVTNPPAGALTHGSPPPPAPTAPAPAPTPVSPTPSPAAGALNPVATGSTPTAGLGQQPDTSTNGTANALNVNSVNGVTLANNIQSAAQSGNVAGIGNTTVGNVTTGDATSIATILNLLQSSTAFGGLGAADFATFTHNIQGDVTGDLMIDPALLQPATLDPTNLGKLTINSQNDGTIQNNINLAATTGNALLEANRTAGDATTGNAEAVANVMNMINSVVAANKSFLGVVNIYGNYTGNILVPTDSLNALLASNTALPPVTAASTVDTETNQNITNNISLAATTGNATSTGNRTVGNTATGDALTNLTILNLTGHQVTAENSLLVFVNVLGTWVGVIMDAPAGATSAALTGGATQAATSALAAQNSSTNATITNNITARAQSGNATANDNTYVGNVTTGSATASANVGNIINSTFSLSHWFGVLFINVFGSWHGSFGAATQTASNSPQPDPSVAPSPPAVFSFVAGGGTPNTPLGLARVDASSFGSGQQYQEFVDSVSQVLSDSDVVPTVLQQQRQPASTGQPKGVSLSILPIALGITGLTFVGAERIRSIRRRIQDASYLLRR